MATISVFDKHTTLILFYWKFAIDKPLALWDWGLSVANFLGHIFVKYTY